MNTQNYYTTPLVEVMNFNPQSPICGGVSTEVGGTTPGQNPGTGADPIGDDAPARRLF